MPSALPRYLAAPVTAGLRRSELAVVALGLLA